jgi:polyribonucleotide nucleotidyltransferase
MKEAKTYSLMIGGKEVTLEAGKYAQSASGSILLRSGDTVMLIAATVAEQPREGIDFFPLLIDYEEKMSSVGRIPGGFNRKEGRASDKAILVSRLIDRPIRPLFPKGYRNDIQVVVQLLSSDEQTQPDTLAVFGASAAVMLTQAPFEGPIGCVRVSRLNGEFIANPTYEQAEESDIDIVIAGTEDSVIMVEAGCKFVTEDDIMAAVDFAQVEIKKQVEAQREFAQQCGISREEFVNPVNTAPLFELIKATAYDKVTEAYHDFDRDGRKAKLAEAKEAVKVAIEALGEDNEITKLLDGSKIDYVAEEFKTLEKKIMRKMIVEEGVRADGRKSTDVRPIWSEVGILPRVHGSAVFTRGQTQVLSVATLAGPQMAQDLDGVDPQKKRSFMHTYSFPAYSVGEVRPMRGPGRREIGHGALAERANIPALPSKEEFGYTIRVTSDVIESNGSTSMASTCGTSMALMNAGVPVKCMIGGVAMGLIKEGDTDVVLTDIQGIEDFLGDMDFKVTGNDTGITALQMDMKIKGIANETLRRALAQAKEGRLHILGKMRETIQAPAEEMSPYAPRIYTLQIATDDIGPVIGPGGKNIKAIIEESGAEINIEDSGIVTITSNNGEGAQIAIDRIKAITLKPEPNMVLKGKVARILPIGAIVEFGPNKDGMVHISQIAQERVNNVEDFLELGQEVVVKVLKIDERGRVNLSIKAVTQEDLEKLN